MKEIIEKLKESREKGELLFLKMELEKALKGEKSAERGQANFENANPEVSRSSSFQQRCSDYIN